MIIVPGTMPGTMPAVRKFIARDSCFPLRTILKLHRLTKTHFQRRITFKRAELSHYFIERPAIVSIKKSHKLSLRQIHTLISRRANSGMNLLTIPYSSASEALRYFPALICRPIINDYHFKVLVSLAQHTLYCLG